ncbi:LamG-like jellyroll fold domain-containing protein [Streptomyces polyrhachis]|uniref:LamG-like jellyroll fold domain-containing protein n=1 Tax=Streptomyces polyrhachis TaxID=1282885 RepID=A0ABW2GIU4_9ACTN
MRTRLGAVTAAFAIGSASLVLAPPAAALTPPVAMTADALSTWQTNGVVWALAQADGVVFTGGTFSAIRPSGAAAGTDEQPAVNFAAFDAATGAPTSCQLSFTVGSGTATVRALAVSPDKQTLYAGGTFGAVNGVGRSNVAAIDIATCTVRDDFAVSVSATVHALLATSDTVYLGGGFATVGGQERKSFAAVTTTGQVTDFTADGTDLTSAADYRSGRALALSPDGTKLALGGEFDAVNGQSSHALAVVDPTSGAVLRAYGSGFIQESSVVKDLTVDGSAFFTANEGTGGFDGRIAINLSDLNQRWRDTCLGATQFVEEYHSVLYSGSHAHDCSSMGEFPNQPRMHLLAQSVDNPAKLGWFPDTNDGIGEKIGPRVVTTASVGGVDYMWVGGEFTTVNTKPQQGLTRFADAPDTGAPSVPWASASSVEPGKVTFSWQSALDLDDSRLTYQVYRDGGATPVYTVEGDSIPWIRPQLTFTDTDVVPGETYTYRVTAGDGTTASAKSATATVVAASAQEAYPAKVLADGATLYWRYDETDGTFAADASGTLNNGVHRGGPQRGVTPGAVPGGSKAIGYDGTSAKYSFSDRRHPRPAQYSVETWFKTTTTSGGKLVGFGNRRLEKSSSYDKHIYMTNSGSLVFGVNSGNTRTITASGAYNDGQWHHVVATQGSGGMRLYVDGVQKASNIFYTGSQDYLGYWHTGGDNLANWPNRPASDYFNGQLDETAVYPTVLDATKVAAHHTLGSAG